MPATDKTGNKPVQSRQESAKVEKQIRDDKTEREIDKTVEDTFPASDPAATY